MIGWLLRAAWSFINFARHQPFSELRRQQEMIDANAAIMRECLPEIIPKSEVATFTGMQGPKRIRITEIEHGPVPRSWLRLK